MNHLKTMHSLKGTHLCNSCHDLFEVEEDLQLHMKTCQCLTRKCKGKL